MYPCAARPRHTRVLHGSVQPGYPGMQISRVGTRVPVPVPGASESSRSESFYNPGYPGKGGFIASRRFRYAGCRLS
eukprot:931809-Rhodomonas_salina.1